MKKIILLLATLMLCGCSVEYNVTIGNNIEETVIVDNIVSVETPAFINDQGSSETNEKIEGIDYYDLEVTQDKSIYKYKFGLNNYSQSTAVNTCLKSVKLTVSNNSYILNTSNQFTCMDYYTKLDDIKINITLNSMYELKNHNADSVTNNIYSWNVNRSNYKNKNIQMIFINKKDIEGSQKPIGSETPGQGNKEEHSSILFVFLVLISFVALLSVLIISKNKKNQRG